MAESYYELLKHPEWQKKRLRVMERDGFACRECGDTQTTLNVHHGYYTKGAKPWEYPDESLRCLCEPCHEELHGLGTELKQVVGQLNARVMELVLGIAKGLAAIEESGGADLGDCRLQLPSFEQVYGAVIAYAAECFGRVPGFLAQEVIAKIGPAGVISDADLCDVIESYFTRPSPKSRVVEAVGAEIGADDTRRTLGGDCRA